MEYVSLIASVPAIVALVNLLKRLGVKGDAAMAAAVVLGVAITVANLYLGAAPAYQAAVQGLILGLAAAGVYDLAPSKSLVAAETFIGMAPNIPAQGARATVGGVDVVYDEASGLWREAATGKTFGGSTETITDLLGPQ